MQGVGAIDAEFHVLGTRNGWFLIAGARYRYGYRGPQPYAGRGWVFGKLITTGLRTGTLKSAPRANAPDVVRLQIQTRDGAEGPDSFSPTAILDCSGAWFRVELPLEGVLKPLQPTGAAPGYVRGWTDAYCTNQLTTCV